MRTAGRSAVVALASCLAGALAGQHPSAGEALAERLLSAASDEERERLLSELSGPPPVDLRAALLRRGQEAEKRGRLAQALPAFELAQRLAQQSGDAPGLVEASLGRAKVLRGRNQLDAAAEQARSALAASEGLGDASLEAGALAELAWIAAEQGDYPEAEARYGRALPLAVASGDRARLASVRSGLGRLARLRGETELSLEHLRASAAILEELGDRAAAARTVNHIGIAHSLRGEYAEAMRAFRQGLAVAEELGDRVSVGHGLNNVGIVYRRQGQLDLALDYFGRSLAVREELGDRLGAAGSHNNIGLVHQDRGDHALALASFRRALALAEELDHKNEMANVLGNIGLTHRLQGAYAEAFEHYERTLRLRLELGDKGGQANMLRSMAIARSLQGQPGPALELAERAAALARETGLRETLADALATAGSAHQALGRPAEARTALDQAIAIVEKLRTLAAAGDEPPQRLLEMMFSPYARMVDLLVARGQTAEALGYAERGKGRVLYDVLRSGRVEISRNMTALERAEERRLRRQVTALNTQLAQERQRRRPTRLAALETELEAARLVFDDFRSRLYAAHPELEVDRGEAPDFRLPEARGLLRDGRSALVEYAVTEQAAHLFVLTAAAPTGEVTLRAYLIPASPAALRALTDELRGQLAGRDLAVRDTARRAYELLLGPARAQLEGRTRLVIVPDGPLWELPFQALVTADGRYLLEQAALSYAPSLTVLREMAARRPAAATRRGTLLALGNPLAGGLEAPAGGRRAAPPAALPESEREVQALGALYGRAHSRILTGPAAREDTFKAEAGRFAVLHLATHGVLDGLTPMRSHVLLAPAGAQEDGLLEASELVGLRLQADLVVLSACETGRGQVTAGEGLIGLSWALFVAGSPTAVVSQWKVDSASTTRLMLEFHRRLRQAAPPAKDEALRQAALKLLARQEHRHPFYWAGFVVVGEGS